MLRYEKLKDELRARPRIWLITGVAGFIGSNLLETLLKLDQSVVGLDNFSTGYQHNLDEVKSLVGQKQWEKFEFIKGDLRDLATCHKICADVDYVLHQAALGSVPRSLKDPISTNQNNIDGFLNILVAARDAKVKSFTYASSSAIYGDQPDLPKIEAKIGNPLSPYAVTKYVNELYASNFARNYGFKSIGLRYFNVFGPRQDSNGAYAAVIPKWIAIMRANEAVSINGDGLTSRDFCYINNVTQANILAAVATDAVKDRVFNIALGERTSLNDLYGYLREALAQNGFFVKHKPIYRNFRDGDVLHSQADISNAIKLLGYDPNHRIREGISEVIFWYLKNKSQSNTVQIGLS